MARDGSSGKFHFLRNASGWLQRLSTLRLAFDNWLESPESQSKHGIKMVDPELRRRPQLFMVGIVPY